MAVPSALDLTTPVPLPGVYENRPHRASFPRLPNAHRELLLRGLLLRPGGHRLHVALPTALL